MINDLSSKLENHNCLAIAMTRCITEFKSSFHTIMIRDQDSLKTFWLWWDTTKLGRYK